MDHGYCINRKQLHSHLHSTSTTKSQAQPLMMRNLLIRIPFTIPLGHGLIKRILQFTQPILKRIKTSITPRSRMREHIRWTVHAAPMLLVLRDSR